MSERRFQGDVTALVPPFPIAREGEDDFIAAGVVMWRANPGTMTRPEGNDRGNSDVLNESTVHLVQDLGGGFKRVAFKRKPQRFSYTKVMGVGDSVEVEYDAYMGGGTCATLEPMRGYSKFGDRAFRGTDEADRVRPGHVAWWNGRAFEVLRIMPFGLAPSAVRFGSEEATPTITRIEVSINDIALAMPPERGADNPDATIRAWGEGGDGWNPTDGVFGDEQMYVKADFSVVATRKIFTTPGDVADADYYPGNASFAAASAEYWYDRIRNRFRVGSGTASVGDVLNVIYYHTQLRRIAAATTKYYVVESSGDGYADVGIAGNDALGVMQSLTTANFTFEFLVARGGSNSFGGGALEWRIGRNSNSAMVAITWTGNVVNAVIYRETQAGVMAAAAITPLTMVGPDYFHLRIEKAGGALTLIARDQGGSNVPVAVVTLPGVVTNTEGFVGVGTWGEGKIKVQGWADGTPCELVEFGDETAAVLSRYELQTWTGVAFAAEYSLPSDRAITAATAEEVDEFALSLSATAERDHYSQPSATKIRFTSETSGDRVRVVQAAPETVDDGPGRPPRVGGTVNFATSQPVPGDWDTEEDGPWPDVATTDVNENRANWYDLIELYDPHGEFDAVEGELIEFRDNMFASERARPSMDYDLKNVNTNWVRMVDGVDYLARWVAGMVMLSQAMCEKISGGRACFRVVEGPLYSNDGAMRARQFNDHAKALDAFADMHVAVIRGGGEVATVSGITGLIGVGVSEYACTDGNFIVAQIAWGESQTTLNQPFGFDGTVPTPPYPFWHSGFWYDATVKVETSQGNLTCGTHEIPERDLTVPEGINTIVSPLGLVGPDIPGSFFGSNIENVEDVAAGYGAPQIAGYWQFEGIAFMPSPILMRAWAGCTCVEALCELTFAGMEHDVMDCTYSGGTIDGADHLIFHRNGSLWVERERAADGSVITLTMNPTPPPTTSGDVGFILMGRRRKSGQVQNWDGTYSPLPMHEYKGLGGVTVPAVDGKKTVGDFAACINALLADGGSAYTDYRLWPAAAGVAPDSGVEGMTLYTRGLIGEHTVELLESSLAGIRYSMHVVTKFTQYDSIVFENVIYCKFRYPDGSLSDVVPVPLVWPKAMR